MTESEKRILKALAGMCCQYIQCDDGELDHYCMTAGEHAVEVLVEYGLLAPIRRGGTWTEAGNALNDAHWRDLRPKS